MSENDKKDFEFIKEQVIEKKRKKIRKRLMPVLMTICLAILFGLIAAITFVVAEPKLYELLHKEEETKTPVAFPTQCPEDTVLVEDENPVNNEDEIQSTDNSSSGKSGKDKEDCEEVSAEQEPSPVIVERKIEASIEDYSKMYADLRTTYDVVNKSIVKVVGIKDTEDEWFGSPVELTEETSGLIVHNNSVELLILASLDRVKDADRIKVVFSDIDSVEATIQAYDSELNLAVIAVPLKDIPYMYMKELQVAILGESYTLAVGSPIIALGSPNGHVGSMEMGIISSIDIENYITDNRIDLFNTDIKVNSNSDGVIVNMKGEVIGLITRVLKDEIGDGVNVTIGISKLKSTLISLINAEPRAYFGVMTEDMSDSVKLEHEITNGIFVNEVIEDSPAFTAGIQAGDIILMVNDQSIVNTNNFYNTISAYEPEEEIVVKIKRTTGSAEREMDITVTLGKKD